MTLLDLIVLLLIAGLCGALGQAIGGFSRVNRSWIHRRAFRNVAGASTRAAGTLPGPHRHHKLSNHLVDHWFSTLCGHHHAAHSQPPIRPHLPMTTGDRVFS